MDRTKTRLRNNEKGTCPLCGSPVTIKAKGRMPAHIWDERIVSFIEPREDGFLWRYFSANREVKPDGKTADGLYEAVGHFTNSHQMERHVPVVMNTGSINKLVLYGGVRTKDTDQFRAHIALCILETCRKRGRILR